MIHAVRLVLADFLSTFVFVVIAAVTGQARLAVVAAVATGVGQLLLQLMRGQQVDAMRWFGVLLTLAFGSATIALHDPRIVMVKPSIVHCALGVVMLRRGWMVRYLPARAVAVLPPALVVGAGRVWAVLMFGLAVANLAVALTLPLGVWGWFISVGALGAKLIMLFGQYVVFRVVARRRMTLRSSTLQVVAYEGAVGHDRGEAGAVAAEHA
jgi:intracellular septation protein A